MTKLLFAPVAEAILPNRPELLRKQEKLRNRIESVNRLRERLINDLNEVQAMLGTTPGRDESQRICGAQES